MSLILRANEINFAILAALPAFFLSLVDTRAKGRGKIARVQKRLLIVEVEKKIVQSKNCIDQGLKATKVEVLCGAGVPNKDLGINKESF
ncbi:hypothetical protein L2E82_20651 [Cichorium intybus]|uniref:Uncharacterized protein n=1 Tax=Cichorium intybus TaxID=13427 RepID=A0ACB9DUR8_CICIN|nr:hypothetical protein L2E82_20651 [Cichorium intybus]